MALQFRRLETSGTDLEQEYHLRNTILRIPLGLVFHLTDEQIEAETRDFHYGMFRNEELVACVIATPIEADVYQIRQMAVIEELQGSGIGRELMGHAEEDLRRNGASEIMLQARDIATGFYERLGYRKVGDWFTHVGIPHLEMRKQL